MKKPIRRIISNTLTFIIGLLLFSIISLMACAVLAYGTNATEIKPPHYTEGATSKIETLSTETWETEYYSYWYDPSYYVVPQNDVKIPVSVACSEDELEILVRVIYLEAGAESDLCIRCVTDVAFNQLQSGLFGDTLTAVLYRPGNYDETVYRIWTIEPSERVREIVMDVYQNGISLPASIVYYRNCYFHTFRYSIPEFSIDNVYFSSSWWLQ